MALLTERAPVLDLGAGNMKVKEGDWQTNIIWRVGAYAPLAAAVTKQLMISHTAHLEA